MDEIDFKKCDAYKKKKEKRKPRLKHRKDLQKHNSRKLYWKKYDLKLKIENMLHIFCPWEFRSKKVNSKTFSSKITGP